MIADIKTVNKIYIVCGYTDMRKAIDGLCSIVVDKFNMDPKESAIFLFCGRRCDRIKILLWESDGFVMIYKRLEVESGKFRWPRKRDEVRNLTWQEFDWLLSGLEISQPKAIKKKNIVDQIAEDLRREGLLKKL